MKPEFPYRKSIRLRDYDYSLPGAYFITVCTHNRKFLFGQIIQGELILNRTGKIVREKWEKLLAIRKNLTLDEFVVMPNHFHGILFLSENYAGTASRAPTKEQFGKPASGSLSSIIRGFKSGVTNTINLVRNSPGEPVWQRGFYEHVIRNEEFCNRIREYIRTNPLSWELDRENPRRQREDEFDRWLAQFKTPPGIAP